MTTPPDTEGVEEIIKEFYHQESLHWAGMNRTTWLRTKLTLIQEEAYTRGRKDEKEVWMRI